MKLMSVIRDEMSEGEDNKLPEPIEPSKPFLPLTRSAIKDTNNDKATEVVKRLTSNSNKFMENFNPETSTRERRKLNRKIKQAGTGKKYPGALFDECGLHIASGRDLCDCLIPDCPGCFFECPKCNSNKCGPECRIHRKYIYDQIDYEGINKSMKFQDILKK